MIWDDLGESPVRGDRQDNNNEGQKQAKLDHMHIRGPKVVLIYTVLSILDQMKGSLGLEAMMEYMDAYKRVIEINDPRLRLAAKKAMEVINVEEMYTQACGDNI